MYQYILFIDRNNLTDASGMPLLGDERVLAELSLDNIIDGNNLSFDGHDQSYTINKKRVHICMKDESGQYYKDDMLMYVLLHELAHCKSRSIGHTPEFHAILDKIYDLARKPMQGSSGKTVSLFHDSNFKPNPNYCTHNQDTS